MKKLIPALCMLLIAAAMLGTSTYAWFSMNRTVTATGMKVKAAAAASLVISKAATTAETNTVTVEATAPTKYALIDATHSTDYTAHATGLKTVTNRGDVDVSTGKKKTAEGSPDLAFGPATNTGDTLYFVDYTFYIASRTAAIENSKLQVVMNAVTGSPAFTTAVSADIYVGTPAEGTYKATLKNNSTPVDVALDGNTIPQSGEGEDIVLVLRVYIDGEDDNVTTAKHSVEEMGFGVTINAVAIGG